MLNHKNKRFGTVYEHRFCAKAISLGLDPHPCPGEYLAHDFLVMNEAGRVYRTQVKGTSVCAKNSGRPKRSARYRVTTASGNRVKSSLDCSKVDLLAAYVEPPDVWYIIPCLQLSGVATYFYPHVENSKAKFEAYREDWNQFLI